MTEELRTFIRVTYTNARRSQGSATAAFERAVNVLLERLPHLSYEEAWREATVMLGRETVKEEVTA